MTHFAPCPDWQQRLSAYQDRQLDTTEAAAVTAHLADCAACRQALAVLEDDRSSFQTAYAGSIVEPALRAAVLKELQAMKTDTTQQVTLPLPWLRWLLGLSGASALACLILAVVVIFQGATPQAPVYVMQQSPTNTTTADGGNYEYEATLNRARTPSEYQPYYTFYSSKPAPSASPMGLPGKLIPITRSGLRNGAKAKGDALYDRTYETGYDAKSYTFSPDGWTPTAEGSGRNYGVPGGLVMSYDLGYRLQVKDALREARKAQEIVRAHAGFMMEFDYGGDEGERPWASMHGKVPADQAQDALAKLEELGQLTGISVAGEDLTTQWKQYMDDIAREGKRAEELKRKAKLAGFDWERRSAEEQRNWALRQAQESKRALYGLQAKHELVEFTATFIEPKPRTGVGLSQVTAVTWGALRYGLLLLATLGVLFALLGMVVAPVVMLRKLRAVPPAEQETPARNETIV